MSGRRYIYIYIYIYVCVCVCVCTDVCICVFALVLYFSYSPYFISAGAISVQSRTCREYLGSLINRVLTISDSILVVYKRYIIHKEHCILERWLLSSRKYDNFIISLAIFYSNPMSISSKSGPAGLAARGRRLKDLCFW